ncbi:hypothetical protein ACFPJ1_00825 [Kribbella qitaiheensis]|uniref:hypothetical protein n=1 Tax=Kribbella qitaiheensis TaxID=1544730 RepID=UPI0036124ADA
MSELPVKRVRVVVWRDRWLIASGTLLMVLFLSVLVLGVIEGPRQDGWKWWHYLMVIGVQVVLALGFGLVTFGSVRFPGAVRRSLLAARTADAEVTVVSIDRPPRPEPGEDAPDPDITLEIRDAAGTRWRWILEWFPPERVQLGESVHVIGEPALGAYLVGVTGGSLLLPKHPLMKSTR